MESRQVFKGVYELRTEYGTDTAKLFTEGSMPHAAWIVTGEHQAILDPGPTSIGEELLDEMKRLGIDPYQTELVIPSHIHVDHAGGTGWLLQELPLAKAVFHSRGAPYVVDPLRLITGTEEVFGSSWSEVFGSILPVPENKIVTVEDEDVLQLGVQDYRVIFMPGHSLDHIGLFAVDDKALYCGHGLGNYKPHRFMPDPPMTLPYFDVKASIESIRKARDLHPNYLLPVHSGFLASNPAFAIDAVERVTIELGELIQTMMAEGRDENQIENAVKTYMFADPSQADRDYMPVVLSYMRYYERQARKQNFR